MEYASLTVILNDVDKYTEICRTQSIIVSVVTVISPPKNAYYLVSLATISTNIATMLLNV